jgi:hypothetical protein
MAGGSGSEVMEVEVGGSHPMDSDFLGDDDDADMRRSASYTLPPPAWQGSDLES